VLWGRSVLLESLEAYKVAPPLVRPGKWETGTQSFESLAGVAAPWSTWRAWERGRAQGEAGIGDGSGAGPRGGLAARFLEGVGRIRGCGSTASPTRRLASGRPRSPSPSRPPSHEASRRLGAQGINTWSGDYYAVGVMEHLGVAAAGGLLRIGFVHYNTAEEVDRALSALAGMA